MSRIATLVAQRTECLHKVGSIDCDVCYRVHIDVISPNSDKQGSRFELWPALSVYARAPTASMFTQFASLGAIVGKRELEQPNYANPRLVLFRNIGSVCLSSGRLAMGTADFYRICYAYLCTALCILGFLDLVQCTVGRPDWPERSAMTNDRSSAIYYFA